MNTIVKIKNNIIATIVKTFTIAEEKNIQITINIDKPQEFGDLNCNAAMVLAKALKKKPADLAEQIKKALQEEPNLKSYISSIEIVNPGFINIHLSREAWLKITKDLFVQKSDFFRKDGEYKKYLIEFVSANPTGPLHLGHGRNAIIGDVLAKILTFLGNTVDKEFYINDAGNQITKLGVSLKIRCQQELGQAVELPEDHYAGEYLTTFAKECIAHYGPQIIEKDNQFFEKIAKDHLLEKLKETLQRYGITFNQWFSEKTLHKDGSIEKILTLLEDKSLAYTKDNALWFKSTDFGDDKDRVIRKADGALTYIAADIAYHKNKFDRGYDILIDILGQDHHGYVKRLKATMEALGYNAKNLVVILYQLVKIKHGDQAVKMSKRAGTFTTLEEIIDIVGTDVARFFYLNRKADAHLEFDLSVALKKTEENPVYYIQYAYVRTNSLIKKAKEANLAIPTSPTTESFSHDDHALIKKICSLSSILKTIEQNYQTHLLSYYTLELAKHFHTYYAHNKIIDAENPTTSQQRLILVTLAQQTLALCLDLLGLQKPEKM